WGFESQNVVPDIAVFGKPIGNAFPLAAVVTTPEIARAFDNGMEFFSTFGGNPVAAAVGPAVLDGGEGEGLQGNGRRTRAGGARALEGGAGATALGGDGRGPGLSLELARVPPGKPRAPAGLEASYGVNRLCEEGILAGTDGPGHNVLKLRPPLVFAESDARRFSEVFERVLAEDPAQPGRG